MRPISFSTTLRSDSVDTVNGIIHGVSVITSGVVARGHDLAVDATTLAQMLAAAEVKGQVPVKVNHKSGAEAVCGYLDRFRLDGAKLKADWHLLATHPQRDTILEVAERMPSGVGLSASFLPPAKPEKGKARCEELLSVDYVTLPAANPDGMFSARTDDRAAARRKAALAKVGRVVGAGALGAAGAAGIAARGLDGVAGLGVRRLVPSPKIRAGLIGAAGALGAAHTVRAALLADPLPNYAEEARRRELAADLAAVVNMARMIKRVPASGTLSDKFLYHVTSTKNAGRIRREGLAVSGTRPMFQNQNSKGKAYLTEAKGVPFWKQRVGEHLAHNHDDPPGVAVFRVRRAGLKLKPDEGGTRDARSPAYYSETPIAAKLRAKREAASDFAAALRHLRVSDVTTTARELAAKHDAHTDDTRARPIIVKPRPSLAKRAGLRLAKIGIGAAGGAYVGRRLGTAAGATTGALAGLLFQSRAVRNAARAGLNFAAKH